MTSNAEPVMLSVKNVNLVPAFTAANLPDLTMKVQRDSADALSSDSLIDIMEVPGDEFSFAKPIMLSDHLGRNSKDKITLAFLEKSARGAAALGKGTVTVADLIKHAEFAASLRKQHVLKSAAQPCFMRVPVAGPLLDGGCISLEVDLLEGSKGAAAAVTGAGDDADTVHANIFVSAKKILATRGSKTDSFCRVMLVLDGEVEHEVGRTETVMDTLSPEYNAYISFSYSVAAATAKDSKTLIRFEICDPGTAAASPAKSGSPTKSNRRPSTDFTVIGAAQHQLSDVHKYVTEGAGSGTMGLYRERFTLRQKGELQGLIAKNEKEKETKYGFLFAVIEKVLKSDACVSMIIGCSKLYTNKLSMRPDPYVKMFRMLDAADNGGLDPKSEDYMPDRCPVYTSNFVKSTREASWSTMPIPRALLENGNPNSRIVVEVWDEQFQAEDRLIGFVELSAAQLLTNEHGDGPKDPKKQTYSTPHMLKPPGLFAQTNSAIDRTASVLSGGVASKPGTFSVLQVKTFEDAALAGQHADCFDVDTVLREKKASQPLSWEPLTQRRAKYTAKIRSGLIIMDSTCGSRCVKAKRSWSDKLATIGVQKYIKKYAPFYRMRLFVGAKFGTAFEAYFAFYYTLIGLNCLISLVWLIFLIFPQIVLNRLSPFQVLVDLAYTFDVTSYVTMATEAAAEAGESLDVDLSALARDDSVFNPGVLLFSGYYPEVGLSGLDAFGAGAVADALPADRYQVDFFYVSCLLVSIAISLLTVVCSLGGQIGAVRETGSSSRGDGTGQVMEAIFGGWDHQGTSSSAVTQTRYALVTQMKEGMGEAVRAAEKLARVKTAKEKRNLFLKRTIAFTLICLLVVLSVTIVFIATSPASRFAGLPFNPAQFLLDLSGRLPIALPLPTLIVVTINGACPQIIKALVALESLDSPETEVFHTLTGQIILKLANLIVLYLAQDIGTVSTLMPKPAAGEPDMRCPEEQAAKNFVTLLVTDACVAGIAVYLVKWLLYHPARFCKEKVMGKEAKTAEEDNKAVCGPFGKKGVVDLPTEIVNICYRQTIMLVGTAVSPWIFFVGILTSSIIYTFKYLTIAGVSRPPIKPFKASNIKKMFYGVLLLSNIVGLFPVALFLNSPSNPNCGPLRTIDCALVTSPLGVNSVDFQVHTQNATACAMQTLRFRPNYQVFTSTILPVNVADIELQVESLMNATSSGDIGSLATLGADQCDAFFVFCWISIGLTAATAPVSLLIVTMLLCICLYFTRKQAKRLNKELDAANDEVAQEHHDKVKLLRYAGVSLD